MWRWISVIAFCFISWSSEAQDPVRYDVVLHEIFADPTPSRGLPASEFIELRNRSLLPVNLKNWTVRTSTGLGRINMHYILQPDSIVILCSSAAANVFQSFGPTVVVTNFPALNNDGDSLLLNSPSGKPIHGLVWSKDWYKNEVKKEGGWSLEMKDINLPCEFNENWSASIDVLGGTPGKRNSINEIVNSTNTPILRYSYIKEKQNLYLQFSKPVDISTANVQLSPHIEISTIEEQAPLFNSILVKLKKEADPATVYSIQLNNVKTCNATLLPAITKRTGIIHSPALHGIQLNEILFNPPTGGADFIEVINNSDQIIDVKQLRLANRGNDGKLSTIVPFYDQPYPIFPGEYFIISPDPAWIKARYFPPDSIITFNSTLPSYPDEKGIAVLLDEHGNILDELNYDEKWHFTLLTNKEGIALERINPLSLTQDPGNWHSASGSIGYATPGYRNSQYSTYQSTDKYFALNTKIISPDNDGQDDFVLLSYHFPSQGSVMTIRIYDATGREITMIANNVLCGKSGQFRWNGYAPSGKKLNRGFYILYAEAFNINGEVMRFKESIALYGN